MNNLGALLLQQRRCALVRQYRVLATNDRLMWRIFFGARARNTLDFPGKGNHIPCIFSLIQLPL